MIEVIKVKARTPGGNIKLEFDSMETFQIWLKNKSESTKLLVMNVIRRREIVNYVR